MNKICKSCDKGNIFCGVNKNIVKVSGNIKARSFNIIDIGDDIIDIDNKVENLCGFFGIDISKDFTLQTNPYIIISTIDAIVLEYDKFFRFLLEEYNNKDLYLCIYYIAILNDRDLYKDEIKETILNDFSEELLLEISRLFRLVKNEISGKCTGGNDTYANIISNIVIKIEFCILGRV